MASCRSTLLQWREAVHETCRAATGDVRHLTSRSAAGTGTCRFGHRGTRDCASPSRDSTPSASAGRPMDRSCDPWRGAARSCPHRAERHPKRRSRSSSRRRSPRCPRRSAVGTSVLHRHPGRGDHAHQQSPRSPRFPLPLRLDNVWMACDCGGSVLQRRTMGSAGVLGATPYVRAMRLRDPSRHAVDARPLRLPSANTGARVVTIGSRRRPAGW